ncbi:MULTISPECIES: S9 family peptidase [Halolamina]|uniref:Dipeptidyl aminopeptidase/acylaminoacyl peptidase n=1 Tax=Halolamina pelagica TaxID=699431 RepID=A0A1I5QV60_9EURY|nr:MULTISPECIES: S9 family peptidase [Halolamina]NHX35557.1 S9 family peptidase [Halolamina sp. R1-12]SFP50135.1 Dipeptidyl aminopeptidase/acylaminoacyl peptidase [Halolamina pelagica]
MSTTPYGEWESPVSAADVAADTLRFGPVEADDGSVYWLERRPDEEGRGVVVRADGAAPDEPVEVTPEDADVRTLVHEYGGGDFAVQAGTVFYADFDDQRLYRVDGGRGAEPTPITPEPETEHGLRYADMEVSPDGERLYAVRERHEGEDAEDEAVNELVTLPADGSEPPAVVAAGHDFYAFPRLSPDGDRLAWTTWDHPRMPWDGTELHVADVGDGGTLAAERVVMGGPEESVFQPGWSPDGELHAVSDRTGWWNLYEVDADGDDEPRNRTPEDAEFGVPQWSFGLATYAFLDDGRVAVLRNRDGEWSLCLLDDADELTETDLPFSAYPHARLATDGETLAFVGGGPTTPETVARWTPDEGGEPTHLRQSFSLDLPDGMVSEPEHVDVPTRDGGTTHAYYYPPTNADERAPEGEDPPLVTMVHGGPTSQTLPVAKLAVQFFTTRGFAVADVNYRGSTGYGRDYRDALQGEWGVLDTADCVDTAEYLAEIGRADPDRLAITGGSAGGYAVLCALAFHGTFDAGASHYGVADLEALATGTHKFESRYLDGLVGPLPEARETYEERSPAFHAEAIDAPLLLLQGGEDRVVPQEQAEDMVDALVATETPYAYALFPAERHGFRTADATRRALELELAFYGETFGFEPADEIDEIKLHEGQRSVRRVE